MHTPLFAESNINTNRANALEAIYDYYIMLPSTVLMEEALKTYIAVQESHDDALAGSPKRNFLKAINTLKKLETEHNATRSTTKAIKCNNHHCALTSLQQNHTKEETGLHKNVTQAIECNDIEGIAVTTQALKKLHSKFHQTALNILLSNTTSLDEENPLKMSFQTYQKAIQANFPKLNPNHKKLKQKQKASQPHILKLSKT